MLAKLQLRHGDMPAEDVETALAKMGDGRSEPQAEAAGGKQRRIC